MAGLPIFDDSQDDDAIADMVRRAIASAILEVRRRPRCRNASEEDQFNGFVNGGMVGALGIMIAYSMPGSEREFRDHIIQNLPFWFDRALEIMDREPLEATLQ